MRDSQEEALRAAAAERYNAALRAAYAKEAASTKPVGASFWPWRNTPERNARQLQQNIAAGAVWRAEVQVAQAEFLEACALAEAVTTESDELTNPEYNGPVTDPVLLVLNRHQWIGQDDFRGFCLCGDLYGTTPHGYRLHVRQKLAEAHVLFMGTS